MARAAMNEESSVARMIPVKWTAPEASFYCNKIFPLIIIVDHCRP